MLHLGTVRCFKECRNKPLIMHVMVARYRSEPLTRNRLLRKSEYQIHVNYNKGPLIIQKDIIPKVHGEFREI
jgi:hypothetical protein